MIEAIVVLGLIGFALYSICSESPEKEISKKRFCETAALRIISVEVINNYERKSLRIYRRIERRD